MKIYKKLAGQTIIYGMGSIVPKILNYVILTAYYTRLFDDPSSFGIITELYAYVTFLMVILTYGTETGFFRFAQRNDSEKVFSSLLVSLFTTSLLFILIVISLSKTISRALDYAGFEQYIIILALIVGIDAFSTLPFAKLRKEEKSTKFAVLKIVNVLVTIIAVLFFYEFVPKLNFKLPFLEHYERQDVVYVFLSNLIASSVILILLIPEIVNTKFQFDKRILQSVLVYSFPLLIAGLAGTINEALDRILLKHMIADSGQALYVLGIYGANYRVAMLLSVFVQMFRYAVEPFYFNYYGKSDDKEVFARILRLFIAVMAILTMIILFYLKYIKFFIPANYHEGLKVIPVVLVAFIFYGIFFNQSIWYKLTKHTGYAILLTLIGAAVTIIANVFFVKYYSYMAAAYGHLFAYLIMMIVSYFIGRKYYPINYKLLRILEYIIIALIIFVLRFKIIPDVGIVTDSISALLIGIYLVYVLYREDLLTSLKKFPWKLK